MFGFRHRASGNLGVDRSQFIAGVVPAVAIPLVWMCAGPAVIARLVLWRVLPSRLARRDLQVALALAHLRTMRGGQCFLEVEACVSDSELKTITLHLGNLLSSTNDCRASLAIRFCAKLSAKGFQQFLATAPPWKGALKELDFHGCSSLGNAAAEALKPLMVEGVCGLEGLGLADCGLTADGVFALSEAVTTCPIPPSEQFSAASLSAAMQPNSPPPSASFPVPVPGALSPNGFALKSLQLSLNVLTGSGRSLAALIRGLTNLVVFRLEGCALDADDVQQLARALPRSSVSRLDLADNALRSKGLIALTKGLRLSNIHDLGLERNEIGFGDALLELKEAHDKRPFPGLRLDGNRLTSSQVSAFLASLRNSPAKRFGGTYCPPGCNCFEGRGEVM